MAPSPNILEPTVFQRRLRSDKRCDPADASVGKSLLKYGQVY